MKLDCGDNSCQFAEKITGMRTNGGCRCFQQAGYPRSAIAAAHKMLPDLLSLKVQLVQSQASEAVKTRTLEQISTGYDTYFVDQHGLRETAKKALSQSAPNALLEDIELAIKALAFYVDRVDDGFHGNTGRGAISRLKRWVSK